MDLPVDDNAATLSDYADVVVERRSAICAKTWSFVAGWLDWEGHSSARVKGPSLCGFFR